MNRITSKLLSGHSWAARTVLSTTAVVKSTSKTSLLMKLPTRAKTLLNTKLLLNIVVLSLKNPMKMGVANLRCVLTVAI